MSRQIAGRLATAALTCLLWPGALHAATLEVQAPDRTLLSVEVAEGEEWCLKWHHSVTGGRVADCFVNTGGHMVLEKSYLHDFAAGLGEVQGRGTLVPAEGRGYWITGIDERIAGDTLVLRVGRRSVGHHLTIGGADHRLSEQAAGERVTLRLRP
ncbi:DUF1850 domain-containing protein [Tranquillimonas rosea]|uniref:DUF1850 domain-containing protein n=1 Tax=Tranquillimonas rosea TaxID=641238 RepID=UPI003BA9CB51